MNSLFHIAYSQNYMKMHTQCVIILCIQQNANNLYWLVFYHFSGFHQANRGSKGIAVHVLTLTCGGSGPSDYRMTL